MKVSHSELSKNEILAKESTIEGGKRLITTSYQTFKAKLNQLRLQGKIIKSFAHKDNQYRLEW